MGEPNDHVQFVVKKILQPIDLVNPSQANPYRLHCSQLELRHSRVQLFLWKLIVVINVTKQIHAGLLRVFL